MLDKIRLCLQSDCFYIIGNLASILSLVLTVWVLINVREIKRSYVFRARLPVLMKQLRHHSKQISQYLLEFEDSRPQIRLEMGMAEVTLNSLKGKVPRATKPSVVRVLTIIKAVDPGKASKEDVFEVYAELIKIEAELKNAQADLELEL